MKKLIIIGFLCCLACKPQTNQEQGQAVGFHIDTLITSVEIPWGMDWLPDRRMLITDRGTTGNNILIYDPKTLKLDTLCNIPKVYRQGDGGMLDIRVHPDYPDKPFIYYAYSTMRPDSSSTLRVERAKLNNHCLIDRQKIFEVFPYFKSSSHYGCRMAIKDDYIYISMGERYKAPDSAQTLSNHFGKILRLNNDGRIPQDNPFINQSGSLPEIWSYGHRNPQGMAIHPETGELWSHEHGPQGGDEINIVRKGLNYGWPVITYGEEYGGGPIGDGITHKEGMEQPLYYYVPSIAPSGMMFYTGEAFPEWKGNLFIGAMALRHLNRLVLSGDSVIREERLLEDKKWRVRIVRQGPDGLIYIGVDGGMILRIRPVN